MKGRSFLISFKKAPGELKVALFEEREHLVVPVVMMVEGVVWAANSPRPELVLASELARAPKAWNGRPVMGVGHPVRDGEYVSANDPTILELERIGMVFNAHVAKKRLLAEAWVDRTREVSASTLDRLARNETIEISVGAFLNSEDAKGTYNGQKYEGIWRDIVPDHLAFLTADEVGACSVEMGCGAPRVALVHVTETEEEPVAVSTVMAAASRLLSFFKNVKPEAVQQLEAAEAKSDRELRQLLERALYKIEPGFQGVYDVFQADGTVVYAVAPDQNWLLFERTFTIGEDKTVTFGDRAQVEPVTRYERVAASGSPEASTRAACGCGGNKTEATLAAQGEVDMDKKQRVATLIASKHNAFTAGDTAFLEGLDEARLTAFEASTTAAEKAAEKVTEPVIPPVAAAAAPVVNNTTVTAPKVLTLDEYISAAPVEIQTVLRDGITSAAGRRQKAITALKVTKQTQYDDTQVAAMSTPEIERLVDFARSLMPNVVDPTAAGLGMDYAGLGVARQSTNPDEQFGAEDPPDLFTAVRTARGIKTN